MERLCQQSFKILQACHLFLLTSWRPGWGKAFDHLTHHLSGLMFVPPSPAQEEEDRLREEEEQKVREEAERQRKLDEQAARQAQRLREIEERQAVRFQYTHPGSIAFHPMPTHLGDAV